MDIEYRAVGLDCYYYEVTGGMVWDTLRQAKQYAKRLAGEKEAIAAGMVKVEVYDHRGDCIADYFVKS